MEPAQQSANPERCSRLNASHPDRRAPAAAKCLKKAKEGDEGVFVALRRARRSLGAG
jgi:hypothetical protein